MVAVLGHLVSGWFVTQQKLHTRKTQNKYARDYFKCIMQWAFNGRLYSNFNTYTDRSVFRMGYNNK